MRNMTYKQREAAKNIVENGGNIGKAMRDAGYSEKTARTPSKLTESKGFRELIDEEISDEYLIKLLKEELEYSQNRKPYLEMAFKLKGKLNPKNDNTNGILPEPILELVNYSDVIEAGKAKYI
jgi:phage terminase small subunit